MSNRPYDRRTFLKQAAVATLGLAPFRFQKPAADSELTLYIGTYTNPGKSKGIYVYRMLKSTGKLKHAHTVEGVIEPSFLAMHPNRKYLYAVNELTEFEGKQSGAVSAFSINQRTGDLTFINQQPSVGAAPCHLVIDQSGKFALVANYEGGNASVLPIDANGRLAPATDVRQHRGAGLDPERQNGPHAHCVRLDRANRYALVTDLGIDRIMVYQFDSQTGKLRANQPPSVQLEPGAGPRHFVFHPGGKFGYVINELNSTLTAFAYLAATGTLKPIQTVSTLPKEFSGKNDCADVHVSRSGRFLYGSNRGHDSIVVFAIDGGSGMLTFVEHVSTRGETPRNFTIDPSGKFLLVANQASDSVVVFHVNPSSGRLKWTGFEATVPTPVCLLPVPSFS